MGISLIVMGLALTPIWALVTFDTPQHAVTKGNQPVEKADPPRCEGTRLLKGKPLMDEWWRVSPRWPIRDSSSLHLHQRFCDQSSTKVILSNLSWGRCAYRLRESSSMPGIIRHVDGPSSLSGWREMLSLEKQSIDLSRLCWQTEEPGGPRVWKSSR